jgi:hypothetical protein
MKRSEVTYSQLDQVLRALGFSWRPSHSAAPGQAYEHKKTGALILLPPYSPSDRLLEHHLVSVRAELDHFGIADPATFAAKLQKAG